MAFLPAGLPASSYQIVEYVMSLDDEINKAKLKVIYGIISIPGAATHIKAIRGELIKMKSSTSFNDYLKIFNAVAKFFEDANQNISTSRHSTTIKFDEDQQKIINDIKKTRSYENSSAANSNSSASSAAVPPFHLASAAAMAKDLE